MKNKRNPFHQDAQNIPRTPLFLQTRPKQAEETGKENGTAKTEGS
ncbi:hypothetical protein [Streptomyces koyangensis]